LNPLPGEKKQKKHLVPTSMMTTTTSSPPIPTATSFTLPRSSKAFATIPPPCFPCRCCVRIRLFDAERQPSQRHSRPDADAERSPSASPPPRVDNIDLLCDGAASDNNEEMVMADIFRFEDEQPGGEEEGTQPTLPPLPQRRFSPVPRDRNAPDNDGSWRTTMRVLGAEGAAVAV
jgi:hypothetical protein